VSAIGDEVAHLIRRSGLSIYDDLSGVPEAFYDIDILERRLNALLRGLRWDYAPRTRSKAAKQAVAEALGYPVPGSFAKTQPRFPGQNLDTAVQMADNLQIWNEEVDPLRRYALIRVDRDGTVVAVRVVTGEVIALWDKTGTLTSKYQAKRLAGHTGSRLVSSSDTPQFVRALAPVDQMTARELRACNPTDRPSPGRVLSIRVLFDLLRRLEGYEFEDPGVTQDRARGIVFQQLVCERLGLGPYGDVGQFPDILVQAVEVKLQLSPTIDLGLVLPTSEAPAQELGYELRHADARYAIAYGTRIGTNRIRLDEIIVSTGRDFFSEFQRFEGKVQNRKLQIPLPRDLFDAE
jgi:hypothetical protein